MQATVRLPGVLRSEAGNAASLVSELADGATLADLFTDLAARHPRLERRVRDEQGEVRRYINVFVDGEECRRLEGMRTPLRDGIEVHIIPSVAGGA